MDPGTAGRFGRLPRGGDGQGRRVRVSPRASRQAGRRRQPEIERAERAGEGVHAGQSVPVDPVRALDTLIVAIDTTGARGSIALVSEAGVLEEVELDSPDGFAHVLFGEIEALLARAGGAIGDIA